MLTSQEIYHIRDLLVLGVLGSNVLVWIGVYLEDDKFSKKTQTSGWRMLLLGLAAEAVFSAFLFTAESAVDQRQELTIAKLQLQADAAESKIAAAQATAALDNEQAAKFHEQTVKLESQLDPKH